MAVAIIVIIIIGIILHNKNTEINSLSSKVRKLEKEIVRLRTLLKDNNIPYSKNAVQQTSTQVTANTVVPQSYQTDNPVQSAPSFSANVEQQKTVVSNPNVKHEKEINNSAILAIGAFLIIFAAISFLSSTWNISSNFLKIFVLIIIALMFFGMSHLAKNKLKIEKTANTFLYIGLAYIPVVLFAFSILNLIGDYFSISGAGKFIYLALSSLVTMLLYFFFAYKNKDERLYFAARAMRFVFIGLFTAIFTEEYKYIFAVLSIYTFLLNLYKPNVTPIFKKNGEQLTFFLTLGISAISVPTILACTGQIVSIIYLVPLILNAFICYARDEEKELMSWAIPISLVVLPYMFLMLENLTFSDITKQIIMLVYLILAFIIFNITSKNIKHNYNILNVGIFFIFALGTLFSEEKAISSFLILAINTLANAFLYYKKEKNSKELLAASLISNYLVPIFGVNVTATPILDLICAIITTIIATLVYRKDETYKIIPIAGTLLFICAYQEILIGSFNVLPIILGLGTILLTYLSTRSKDSVIYLVSSALYLIAFIALYNESLNELFCMGIIFVWSALHYFFTTFKIAAIFGLATSFLPFTETQSLAALTINLLSLILITYDSIKNKDSIPLYVASLFFLCTLVFSFDYITNIYAQVFMFAIWCIIQIVTKDSYLKDISKTILTFSFLALYQTIIQDLGVQDITAAALLGIIAAGQFINRGILAKYISSTKVIEYIFFALIYLYAFSMYTDPVDALIFIVMLAILVIASYILKYGPMFLCSIIAIVLNTLLITAGFWLAIPWWIYLIAVGAAFLSFAMRNELRENSNKPSIKEWWANTKNKYDL